MDPVSATQFDCLYRQRCECSLKEETIHCHPICVFLYQMMRQTLTHECVGAHKHTHGQTHARRGRDIHVLDFYVNVALQFEVSFLFFSFEFA